MKTYFKLAWRNIWRNKRRTIITVSSIFFALFFALIMRSLQLGSYDSMINNVISSFTGHIQLHGKGFWEEKTLDFLLVNSDSLNKKIESIPLVKSVVPRFESFALASSGVQTKGVLVTGIDPLKEDLLSKVREKIVEGEYFDTTGNDIIVSQRLAKFLKVSVNDTLVLLGQGFQGVSAAGKYRIRAIAKLPSPALDKQVVFLSLHSCQEFYSAENMLTSLSINISRPKQIEKCYNEISAVIDTDTVEAMTWQEMSPEMVQQIESDNASGLIMLGLLYMIIAFGVLGTVLMMASERTKEFGVMVSVGMQKYKLALIVILELIIIGIIGILFSITASSPLIYYFHINPIPLTGSLAATMESYGLEATMPLAWDYSIFLNQSIVILILIVSATLIPTFSIFRLNVIKALRK